jgi:methyl-accepting chemotaxis protein
MRNMKKYYSIIPACILLTIMIIVLFVFEDKLDLNSKRIIISVMIIFSLGLSFIVFFLITLFIKTADRKIIDNNNLFNQSNRLLATFYDFLKNNITSDVIKAINIDFNYTSAEISEMIEEFYNKSDEFLKIISSYKMNLENKINEENKDQIKENMIKIKQHIYSEFIIEFIKSTIKNTENVSSPLSDSIYQIKLKINDFKENIDKWKNEFTDQNSEKNFNKIIAKYEMQDKNFDNIFLLINRNYLHMEKNFDNIMNMIEKIVINTGEIEKITEKIRILSINASIEAARAGEAGKGFKIVSNEVKKLSNETQAGTKEILPLTKQTKDIVNSSISEYNNELMNIINMINMEKDEFKGFYEILKNYYNDLNSLFSSVTDVINDINKNIDGLTPLFQYSNLTVQEMGNIIKMIDNNLIDNKSENDILAAMDEKIRKELVEKILSSISKVITTESEVNLINELSDKNNLNVESIKKKNNNGIEIF